MAVYFIVFWTLIHVFGIWNTNRLKEALTHTQNVQGKKHAHLDLADALGADSFLSCSAEWEPAVPSLPK